MRFRWRLVQIWYIMRRMPTYQTRNGRTRAIIRLKGYKPVSETFPTKPKARAWAIKTEAAMLSGDHVEPTKITVRQLFERYSDQVADDKWTKNRIKQILRDGGFSHVTLNQCEDLIAAWVERRRKEVKPNTVIRETTVVSTVFKHAMRRWKIRLKHNPMRDIDKPPKGKHRRRRVSDKEIARLWGYFGLGAPTLLRDYVPWVFEFACETGMRLSEITRLTWEDVHLRERWAFVAKSKNGDERHALLTARAVELVKMLPKCNTRVFPVNANSVGTEFRVALAALGINDLHFHDSRHEACSRLCKYLTVMELAAVIGHRDLKSLMIYYNPTPAELASKLPDASAPRPRRPQPTT